MATTDLLRNKVSFRQDFILCFYCIKGCNQKQGIMDTEVVKVLKSWKSSLDHYENFHIQ